MENLLVGRISRSANIPSNRGLAEIFDMIEHRRLLDAIDNLAVLTASNTSDVGRNACINDDILVDRIIVRLESSQNKEAPSRLQCFGLLSEERSECWERKCALTDVADGVFESYRDVNIYIDIFL